MGQEGSMKRWFVLIFAIVLLLAPGGAYAASFTATGSMTSARNQELSATLLADGKVLVSGGFDGTNYLNTAESYDRATGTFTPTTGTMISARAGHTATLLPDGKVLIAGGFDGTNYLNTAEIYDSTTGLFTPTTGAMNATRFLHTATLLPDGKVLIAGGNDGTNSFNTAELYDPSTGLFIPTTGAMNFARSLHTATLLANGKVLIAGGVNNTTIFLNTAEIYDPATGRFTSTTGNMNAARQFHTATLLPDGRVLIAGGQNSTDLNTTETYDYSTDTFTLAANMNSIRMLHTATLQPNGKVLITGGLDGFAASNTAEVYDPATGSFTATPGNMNAARMDHKATLLADSSVLIVGGNAGTSAEIYNTIGTGTFARTAGAMNNNPFNHSATLLPNNTVLIAGGENDTVTFNTAQTYNPAKGTFTPTTGIMTSVRSSHTATLLATGKVLIAGGDAYFLGVFNSAETYDPASGTFTATGTMNSPRISHTATLLPDGKVLITGGYDGLAYLNTAEIYNPATGVFTPTTGTMTGARSKHTATLLPDGTVLLAGGFDGTNWLSTAEIYNPSTGTFASTVGGMVSLYYNTATLLPDGTVLLTGPFTQAEIYHPSTGLFTSTVGAMVSDRRYQIAATLLPNGTVLIAGGDNTGTSEIYDPSTGSFTAGATMALGYRPELSTTLLPDGTVLVAGVWARAEIYDAGPGFSPAWQPVLTTATPSLALGSALVITGSGFRGYRNTEASGGGTNNSSATNYPLVQLQRIDNGQVKWLLPDPATPFTATTFTSLPVTNFAPGQTLVTVFVNGIPSASKVVVIESTAPAISFIPTAPGPLDFTSVPVGATSPAQSFTIANIGTADLIVMITSSNPVFKVNLGTCGVVPVTIAPGASCRAKVTFTPISYVETFATLSITSNDPNTPAATVVNLHGIGTIPAAYTITATSGANGSIFPAGVINETVGASQQFTFSANTGYKLASITVDGVPTRVLASYTFTSIAANHTIAVTFSPTIVASAGANGSISPLGTKVVASGASQTYTITPAAGYRVNTLTVDGSPVTPATTYSFSNVTTPHTIAATFALKQSYTITASSDLNGSISPAGAIGVTAGASQKFTFTANPGYQLSSLTVDGVPQGTPNAYTFTGVAANHTIAIAFSPTIIASAGANGSISPLGTKVVASGGSQTYTITPAAGYQVAGLTIDGSPATPATSYIFSNVTTPHTIKASFTAITTPVLPYTITATSGPNGSISPAGAIGVAAGAKQQFTFAANSGYKLSTVIVDGVSVSALATYTFRGIAANHTITVTFSPTISATAGPNGKISPVGTTVVASGGSKTYTITPAPGYHVDTLTVDGTPVTPAASYTFTGVTTPHSIAATFVQNSAYTITASSDPNGSISPAGAISVTKGSSQQFTIAATPGYRISNVTVDGTRMGALTTYTFANIAANHTIAVSITPTITATAGANGSISPLGTSAVASGGSQTYTITAAAGYHVDTLTVDGTSVAPAASYTFTNVTTPHTIAATFVQNPNYTITATASGSGFIVPAGAITVVGGANQQFTFTANSGYQLTNVTVDGIGVIPRATYTFGGVAANHTIDAAFSPTISATTPMVNGTISPIGITAVTSGTNKTYTIIPVTGYHVSTLTVDGVSVTPATSYTFTNVTTPHTIAATFALN